MHVNSLLVDEENELFANCTFILQEDDARSSGTSSPESTGSVETSISSHFGGMNYPSLFSSRPSGYGASQSAVCNLFNEVILMCLIF